MSSLTRDSNAQIMVAAGSAAASGRGGNGKGAAASRDAIWRPSGVVMSFVAENAEDKKVTMGNLGGKIEVVGAYLALNDRFRFNF
jgi:hypothetical protein